MPGEWSCCYRTRIRETIIRGIEGGDFYARGHIRAIAKAVGTDAEPLIGEYDTLHRAPGAAAAVSLEELVATSAAAPQRRRGPHLPAVWAGLAAACVSAWRQVNLPAVWAAVAAACVSGWRRVNLPAMRDLAARACRASGRRVNWAAVREAVASAYASAGRRVALPGVPERAARAGRPGGRRVNWTAALALVVVLSFGVYRLLAPSPQAPVPHAASQHADGHRHGQPSAPNPATSNSHAATAPSAAPAVRAQPLAPVHAAAFGPGGGDNPQLAHLSIGGHHAAGWHTDWYTSATFGNLYPGTGLLLDMGRTVTVTGARIALGYGPGAALDLRIGRTPTLARMRTVAHSTNASHEVLMHLQPTRGRYVLVWFTRLPPDQAGTFQASVYDIKVLGHW